MASLGSAVPRYRILVVDDDRLVRAALARTLSRIDNADIEDFSDSSAALAHAAENRFSVAVLDLQMPGIDGAELGARLRAIQPDLPLIFVTADTESALADRARALLAHAIVAKPWGTQELVSIVTSLWTPLRQ